MALQPFETRDSVPGEVHTAVHHNRYVRNALLWLKSKVDELLGLTRTTTWIFAAASLLPTRGALHRLVESAVVDALCIRMPGNEISQFNFQGLVMPDNYAGGNITIKVYWYDPASANNADSIVLRTAVRVVADGLESFGVVQTNLNFSSANNNLKHRASDGTLLDDGDQKTSELVWSGSLPAAGNTVEMKIERVGNNADDNAGEIFITRVAMAFTRN